MNTFANRVKILRLERGLTQTELGKAFNLTKSAVSSWENRGRFGDEELLKKLAAYFDVSLDYLLGISEIRNPITVETKSFAQELIDSMINKGMITDKNDIDKNAIDAIISAIRLDIKNKK